ncbi:uncharacterized protein LAESUDRAFT_707216 [Laetiporus sulphureus 93-53]|uniref:G domain-containing protein n=1 Tax=Laetiporus sulphureus 93-53 TaxID=1314785 RepID=A0A165BTE8_9APHY|nr:uncharacterized protein LAESUDRAFT_707216 [Laetiporus sulphureus 93-53]KZT01617.1 hypothetical protein LAESUDRAFT_707216 [Laetiporus sulphureus 93-53]
MVRVIGTTGCGKTTFINLVSGADLLIGHELSSCTREIHEVSFSLSTHDVIIIDTPGFDDTERPQVAVLNQLAKYLKKMREEGKPVCGAVYFHRISDRRIGRTAIENIRSFQVLCKDEKIDNTMIATTMWSEVSDTTIGVQSEEQLQGILGPGARLLRHDNGVSSAEAIVRELLFNAPLVLQIQRELIELRRTIPQTEAGRELGDLLSRLEEVYRKELQRARDEMTI